MAKIKTAGAHRFGNEYTYIIGKVKFDTEGIAEVEDSLVQELLACDKRLSLLDEKPKKDNIDLISEEAAIAVYIKELKTFEVPKLRDLAIEAGFESSEIIDLKKTALIDKIVSKLNS